MRFLFCFFDPHNGKKTVVSRHKTIFEIIQHNTVIIIVFSVIHCFFGDNLQGPTLFIKLFQIFLFIMTQNIENNTTPMEIEGDEIDPTVREIDLHLIESAKFVEGITQGRKFEHRANDSGGEVSNQSKETDVEKGKGKDNKTCDNFYFKNFNPLKQQDSPDILSRGTGDFGFMGRKDNNVDNDFVSPLSVIPYQRISEYLNKNVVLYKKMVWTKPPSRVVPITPSSAPKLCLVTTEDKGITLVNNVEKSNECAPGFFSEYRAGYIPKIADFNCPDSYTCTFDVMRRCTVCTVEHDAFPREEVGTLLVGDAYMPVMMTGGGKCVPTFRLHNATFREVAHKLRFLLKSRKKSDEQYIGTPRLIIISLPAYLKTVGASVYLHEFQNFKAWATLFLSTREDIHPADRRIHKPCSSTIRVYEGFSLFQNNDNGLAESFTVIARSNEILTAVDVTQTPGFFHKAMAETMTKFCTNPPPKKELTGYVAIEPVTRDFEVYEHRIRYNGLPGAHMVNGTFEPNVILFFSQQLITLICEWYTKNGLESFLHTLPRSDEIGNKQAFEELPHHVNLGRNSKVFIIGNSNFSYLASQLKSSLDEEIVYAKYPFNVIATTDEINSFIVKLECEKDDIIVLDGMGNSLLQGMLTPKYKRHQPSGEPAGFEQVGAGKTKIFHAINVAPYDPEYFDNFSSFINKIMVSLNKFGVKVVFVTPFPRYMRSCCNNASHFYAGYSGNEFNAEVIRLGTFISRLPSLDGSFVLTPEDYCNRDSWVCRGEMISDDFVHLTPHAITLIKDLVQRCVHFFMKNPELPVPSLGSRVPEGLLFSRWVEEYRVNCGFDDLRSSGNSKRSLPAHKLQRPSKR